MTLFAIVWALIHVILPGLRPEQYLAIMFLRCYECVQRQQGIKLAQTDLIKDLYDKADRKIFTDLNKKASAGHGDKVEYLAEYRKRKKDIFALMHPKGRGRGRGHGAGKGAGRGHAVAHIPVGAITQPEANRLLPPQAHIWNNWGGEAWCGHLRPFERCSAPWSEGHHFSCLKVVRTLWQQYLRAEELAEADCWVQGLLPGPTCDD